MNFIILYGPPAVGKLTTAKSLALKLNYKIFHNHLVIDLVKSVFQQFTSEFDSLRTKLEIFFLEKVSKTDLNGLIFTICYAYPNDNEHINKIENIIKKNNGNVYYIQLLTNANTLQQRVQNEDRKKYGKLTNPDKLLITLSKWDLTTPIPKNNTLLFDNTDYSCEQINDIILKFLKEDINFNKNKINIKEANKKNAIIINSLHKLSAYQLCKNHYSQNDLDCWLKHRTPEGYYNAIEEKNVFIAEYNDIIIGFGNARSGKISQIYVHPDYIKKGVGKTLLLYALKKVKNKEDKKIKLDATINAVDFYKNFGFKEIGKKRKIIDVIEMELDAK